MIIVEGCDNSGKSTLINQIAKPLGIPIVMGMGPAREKLPTEQWIAAALGMAENNPRVIFDRFPLISERIYGPIIRKTDLLNPETNGYARLAYARLKVHEPMIIYCRPPRDAIVKNWQEREQMAGVEENLDAILDGYDRLFRGMRDFDNILVYDYTQDRLDQVMPYVTAHLARTHVQSGRLVYSPNIRPQLDEKV